MMKILIVASNNSNLSSFVHEQVNATKMLGADIEVFGIWGKGIWGYLGNRRRLMQKIKEFRPDVIHAHYGLSGLLANLQRGISVITTYHGSDIHSSKKIRFLSKLAMCLSKHNIFVGRSLYDIAKYGRKNYSILSCGLDLSTVHPIDVSTARKAMGLDDQKRYILFAGSFDNPVKNYLLATKSIGLVNDCELIELRGYTKKEVAWLMNACDALLVTSLKESGPLVVKEAMACNRPIVSTHVGDVEWVMGHTAGCYLTSYDVTECANQIRKALLFSEEHSNTNGRDRIIELELDNRQVATKLIEIYKLYE